MNDLSCLDEGELAEVRIGDNHDKAHPAWRDDSNRGFRICYEIDLVFTSKAVYSIKPCEVALSGQYPALGLDMIKKNEPAMQESLNLSFLPARICQILKSDCLGEEAINQFVFVLSNGYKIIIRHVFPPMSMGIKTEEKYA